MASQDSQENVSYFVTQMTYFLDSYRPARGWLSERWFNFIPKVVVQVLAILNSDRSSITIVIACHITLNLCLGIIDKITVERFNSMLYFAERPGSNCRNKGEIEWTGCTEAIMRIILLENIEIFERIPFFSPEFDKLVNEGKQQFSDSSAKSHYRELIMCVGCANYVYTHIKYIENTCADELKNQRTSYQHDIQALEKLRDHLTNENYYKTLEAVGNIYLSSPAGDIFGVTPIPIRRDRDPPPPGHRRDGGHRSDGGQRRDGGHRSDGRYLGHRSGGGGGGYGDYGGGGGGYSRVGYAGGHHSGYGDRGRGYSSSGGGGYTNVPLTSRRN